MPKLLDWADAEVVDEKQQDKETIKETFKAPKNNFKIDNGKKVEGPMVMYGDLVTLLLVFFIMLFSMSTTDKVKYAEASKSMQDTLLSKEELKKLKSDQIQSLIDIKKNIDTQLIESKNSKNAYTILENRGLRIIVNSVMLFESGKSDLLPGSQDFFDMVGAILKKTPYRVQVEGHTDNIPINTAKFTSNWDLSTSRATKVVDYLIHNQNIDPQRFAASGYSEYHPIVKNDSEQNRAKNRRVEIIILPN